MACDKTSDINQPFNQPIIIIIMHNYYYHYYHDADMKRQMQSIRIDEKKLLLFIVTYSFHFFLYLATFYQRTKYDIYVLDGVEDRRQFIVMNIYNRKKKRDSGSLYYSQGQITAVPSGTVLVTAVCDLLLFEVTIVGFP